MELGHRIDSADAQTFELHKAFSDIEHRIREFTVLQESFVDLHKHIAELTAELSGLQHEIAAIQTSLPGLARKEELQRFTEKLDAIPFEQMASKKDI